MKDVFGREWEMVRLPDKKKKQKEKNKILFPETDKSIDHTQQMIVFYQF